MLNMPLLELSCVIGTPCVAKLLMVTMMSGWPRARTTFAAHSSGPAVSALMCTFMKHEVANITSPTVSSTRLSTWVDSLAAIGMMNNCGSPTHMMTMPICIGV